MILDGLEAGDDNIFPDPMSQSGYQAWRDDPAAFERQMGSIAVSTAAGLTLCVTGVSV